MNTQSIHFEYSSELAHRGNSDEYPKHIVCQRNVENGPKLSNTPCYQEPWLLLLALRTIWDPSKHEVNSMSSALTACMYAQPSLTTDTTLLEFL